MGLGVPGEHGCFGPQRGVPRPPERRRRGAAQMSSSMSADSRCSIPASGWSRWSRTSVVERRRPPGDAPLQACRVPGERPVMSSQRRRAGSSPSRPCTIDIANVVLPRVTAMGRPARSTRRGMARCSTSPPAPAARPSPRPAGSAPPAGRRHRHLPDDPHLRGQGRRRGRAHQRRDRSRPTGRRSTCSRRALRRRDLPRRPHLLPRPAGALRGMHRALRPGGRIAAIVYSTPDRNEFFSLPVRSSASARSCRRRARPAGPVQPRQPRRRSRRRCAHAGFRDVAVEAVPSPLAFRRPPSASASSGSPSAPSTRCSPASPNRTRPACGPRSRPRSAASRRRDGFVGPCELLVAAGTR